MAKELDDTQQAPTQTTPEGVLCFGAAHADYSYATTNFSSQDTCTATSEKNFGGTALNVAKTLSALNGFADPLAVNMLTVKGGDSVAPLFASLFTKHEINATFISAAGRTPSYVAIHDERSGRVAGVLVDPEIYIGLTAKTLAEHQAALNEPAAIICDTSFNPEVYEHLANTVAANVKMYLVLSSISSAGNAMSIVSRCNGVFGNAAEIRELANTGKFDQSESGLWSAMEALAARGAQGIYANNGNKGIFALVNGNRYQMTPRTVEGMNISGSTQVFAATVVHCLQSGQSPQAAIEAGLAAAVIKLKGQTLNAQALRQALEATAQQQRKQRSLGKMLFRLSV